MTSDTVARTCTRHPDRPGAALCMSCRAVVCQECTTTWEGINYCPPCLAAKARPPKHGHGRGHGLGLARAGSAAAWTGLALACVLLAKAAAELAVTTGTLLFGE